MFVFHWFESLYVFIFKEYLLSCTMERKTNNQLLKGLISLVIIAILLNSRQPVTAISDWSDNFPVDGAPADWEFYANLRGDGGGGGPLVPVNDDALHIRVRDGALMSPHYQDTSYGYNFAIRSEAYHNSTQAYGTWSFDWITSSETDRTHIAIDAFMFIATKGDSSWNISGMNDEETAFAGRTAYGLTMNSRSKQEMGASPTWEAAAPGFTLFIRDEGVGGYVEFHELAQNIEGTHHIEIQRNETETGRIKIYYDQELIIEHSSSAATVSEKINYWSLLGDSGIDNLQISNVNIPITSESSTENISPTTEVNGLDDPADTSESNWQYIIGGGLSGAIFIAIFWGRGKKKY